MYAGRVGRARAPSTTSSTTPPHPYTRGLLNSLPGAGPRPPHPDPRRAAEHAPPAVGLRLPPPVPLRRGRVRGRAARAAAGRRPADGLRAGRRPGGGRGAVTATVGRPGRRSVRPDGPSSRSTDLVKNFTVKSLEGVRAVKSHRPGGVGRVVHASTAARRSAWSGSRARASRPSAAASCASSSRPSGSVKFRGQELTTMGPKEMRALRREMQIVFQDPYASLDPRMTIGAVIAEPFKIHKIQGNHKERVAELLRLVGPLARPRQPLPPRVLRRSAPAHRHRPGPGPRPVADRARRAGLGARRVDPGRRRQPARRTCRTASGWPTSSSPTTSRSSATSPTSWP